MDVEQLIANFRDFKPDVPILVGAPNRNGAAPTLSGVTAIIGKPYDATEIAKVAGMRSGVE